MSIGSSIPNYNDYNTQEQKNGGAIIQDSAEIEQSRLLESLEKLTLGLLLNKVRVNIILFCRLIPQRQLTLAECVSMLAAGEPLIHQPLRNTH